MNRRQFQALSRLRLREANALLDTAHYPGAYYLLGYAVECAVKACVAKKVKLHDFPDRKIANEAFTHDLEKLLRVAGLFAEFDRDCKQYPALDLNWTIVKDWSESVRYETGISDTKARDFFRACTGRDGILPWVKKRW